jgi:surface carbohydrate biosynthesis protein
MREKDVLFLVEHITRELDLVTCLVQKLRAQFGIAAEVRSYYHDFKYNFKKYKPKVVVFPFFYGANNRYVIEYLAEWPEAKLLNLAWEQILMKVDYAMMAPRDCWSRENVFHICWTQKHRDFLSSEGARQDHLLWTGNPVMKLYDAPYKNYFKSRLDLAIRYKIDPGRKWVLFPESYQYAFMSERELQEIVEESNGDPKLLAEAREYSQRSLDLLFAWVSILRPRPSTPLKRAREFMRKAIGMHAANIAIIKAESAREWILAADHVVSTHSTTLIEAAIAGKPVHIFAPEPSAEAMAAEWHDLVPSLNDRNAFLQTIRQSPVEQTGARLAAWARARQFPENDPIDAIAKRIAQLWAAREPHEPSSVRDHRWLWNGRSLIELFGKWRRRFRSHPDAFGAHEVARRVSRWRRILEVPSRT